MYCVMWNLEFTESAFLCLMMILIPNDFDKTLPPPTHTNTHTRPSSQPLRRACKLTISWIKCSQKPQLFFFRYWILSKQLTIPLIPFDLTYQWACENGQYRASLKHLLRHTCVLLPYAYSHPMPSLQKTPGSTKKTNWLKISEQH